MENEAKGKTYVIGLTGGIACGKSTVSKMLCDSGAFIIDGDKIAIKLTSSGGEAIKKIRQVFGNEVIDQTGALDRKKMSEIVFSSPVCDKQRQALDNIIHPMVISTALKQIELCRLQGVKLCVLDMPLLLECHMENMCDSVWCVAVSEDVQLQRLIDRNGCTKKQALDRIRSQMSTKEKISRADVVIDNSNSVEDTRKAVEKQLDIIFQR